MYLPSRILKKHEVLLRYYFLLQCTLKCHINITPHPLHIQGYFSLKISHSKHSYPNHRLLILRDIFDRIFFEVLFHCFYRNLSFIFSTSQNKLFEYNLCFFMAFYIAFFDAKKAVKNRILTVSSNPHETCDATEEADKGKLFLILT